MTQKSVVFNNNMMNWWINFRDGWPKKGILSYFQPGPLCGFLSIANHQTLQASFEPGQNLSSDFSEWNLTRNWFFDYYMPLVEFKDFNA